MHNQIVLGDANTVNVTSTGIFYGFGYITTSDRRNKDNIAAPDSAAAIALSKRVGWRTFTMLQSFHSLDVQHSSNIQLQKQAISALKAELDAAKVWTPDSDGADPRPLTAINADLKAAKKTLRKAKQAKRDPAAGVIAQELQALTAELGAFEWLVKTNPGGELSVDYTSLFAIVSAGFQARMEAAGI